MGWGRPNFVGVIIMINVFISGGGGGGGCPPPHVKGKGTI
jgi:hypothetical protein